MRKLPDFIQDKILNVKEQYSEYLNVVPKLQINTTMKMDLK